MALTEIPHVGQSSARRLFNEGLRTAEVIAKASTDVIFNTLCKGEDTLPCLCPSPGVLYCPERLADASYTVCLKVQGPDLEACFSICCIR